MNPADVIFWITAVISVAAALATIAARTPLRSALALFINIASLAVLFISLHAHLLAAIQLIVYAGAVVVLFVFVIMLIGPSAELSPPGAERLTVRAFSAAVIMLLFFSLASLLSGLPRLPKPALADCRDLLRAECQQFGGVERVASVLFEQAAVPFEIASVLLLVAILGAFAVARGRVSTNPASGSSNKWA